MEFELAVADLVDAVQRYGVQVRVTVEGSANAMDHDHSTTLGGARLPDAGVPPMHRKQLRDKGPRQLAEQCRARGHGGSDGLRQRERPVANRNVGQHATQTTGAGVGPGNARSAMLDACPPLMRSQAALTAPQVKHAAAPRSRRALLRKRVGELSERQRQLQRQVVGHGED